MIKQLFDVTVSDKYDTITTVAFLCANVSEDRPMPEHNLNWGMNTPASQQKQRELILYIAQKTKNRADFGSINVNKTMLYADMQRYKDTGRSITGAQYHRVQMGPVPKHALVAERALMAEGAMEMRVVAGANIRVALRDPDLSLFSSDELAVVDQQIERLAQMTSEEVSEDSHDIRWHALQDKDLLPYEFAYLIDDLSAKDKTDAANLAERFGW